MADINECSTNNGNCSKLCINTNGSYVCSCTSGYQIAMDNMTCNGECNNLICKSNQSIRNIFQILMNVLPMEAVHKYASTLMEAIYVHVTLVISLQQTTRLALVSTSHHDHAISRYRYNENCSQICTPVLMFMLF